MKPETKKKIIRITTIPASLETLLQGQLKFMSDYYEMIAVSSPAGDRLENVGNLEGVRTIPVEMKRNIAPLNDLRSVWKMYKILKKEKPIIVHTHTPKAGTVGMLAAYLANVPYRLHTIAGMPLLETKGAKRLLLDLVEKITYKCATKIYPNSFGLKDIVLQNNYTSANKLKILGNGSSNGIDTNHFDPGLYSDSYKYKFRETLGIEKNDFVYIFVGRIVTDKGINELIQAFVKISSQFENVKLLLLGSYEKELDPLLPETENIINTNSKIIAVGAKNDVRPYFAIADVLTFPSYREGFPNVVMQAGSMGLPSIVTDINGCNEIISEGMNGTIIPSKDVQNLYESMHTAYTNQLKGITYDKMEIRQMISDRYNRNEIFQSILKEYQSLLENN